MFFAKTAGSQEWKAIAAAIKTLVEEATFEANSEGLTFRAMDPSHVALVDLAMPNSSFSSFEADKPFKFSVRVEDLVKLIGRSDAKDSVEISSGEDDSIAVKLSNGYNREFTIHLIESTAASAPLPQARVRDARHGDEDDLGEGVGRHVGGGGPGHDSGHEGQGHLQREKRRWQGRGHVG